MMLDDDALVEVLARHMVTKRWDADTWENGLGGMVRDKAGEAVESWREAWRKEARELIGVIAQADRLTPVFHFRRVVQRRIEFRCQSSHSYVSESLARVEDLCAMRRGDFDGVEPDPNPQPCVHECSTFTIYSDGSEGRTPWEPLLDEEEVLASDHEAAF